MTNILYPSDEQMITVTGNVATLYVTEGTVNLLNGMQSKMMATGMAAVVEGMAGSAANSAMLSMYEGENVQHFGCYVEDKMIIGTFEDVGFADGEKVTMIVTKIDENAYFAHAVVRNSDALLWMPFSINKGRFGIALWILKMLSSIAVSGLAFLLILQVFIKAFATYYDLFFVMVPTLSAVGGLIGFFTYKSSVDDGLYAEKIFKKLGFAAPWRVNISPFSQARLRTGQSYQVYDFRKANAIYGSLTEQFQEFT